MTIPDPTTSLVLTDDEWEAVSDAINDRLERLADIQEDSAYSEEDRERAEIAQSTLESLLLRWYHEVR